MFSQMQAILMKGHFQALASKKSSSLFHIDLIVQQEGTDVS